MRNWRDHLRFVGIVAAYIAAGRLGLLLANTNPSATPVWAPTGIALAACLLFGSRVWPAIFAGAFVVNELVQGTWLTSIGIATGNTLEAVIGAGLVQHFAGGRRAFDQARTALLFLVLAAGVGTAISATIGVTTLALGGFAPWAQYGRIWCVWWVGDAAGALVFAPLILLWVNDHKLRLHPAHALEALAVAVALGVASFLIFSDISPLAYTSAPSQFILIPILMWVAFRFGPREAATAVVVISVVAIIGTLGGTGPFLWRTQSGSLLMLQAYVAVAGGSTLVVAAAMNERRVAEDQLREWSISDPLTGLANYRKMVIVMNREIQRSDRTGRSFAFILLDLDGLKKINDRDGHLTGSRALVRLADAMRGAGRAFDTAARFGGDEFAVVMPESDEEDARALAARIAERIAADEEMPSITASVGFAVCPRDGITVETLIGTADRGLYDAKKRQKR